MEMPTLNELSAEQADVLALPFDKNYLITGPPGTGKSVMAMFRLSRILKAKGITGTTGGNDVSESDEARLITYNKLLTNYMQSCLEDPKINVPSKYASTYHSYFQRYWNTHLAEIDPSTRKRQKIPLIDPGDRFSYNFEEIKRVFNERDKIYRVARYFIIDEGQDLPPELYELANEMCDHITVFADEHQSIRESNKSEVKEIYSETMVEMIMKLTKNYRNTRPIAMLARKLFPGNQDDLPGLPERGGDMPEIMEFKDYEENIQMILNHANTFGGRIGIFLPEAGWASRWAERLKTDTSRPVFHYTSKMTREEKNAVTFREENGIFVMHYMNAKGLEFDTVFISEMQHKRWPNLDQSNGKHWFYVFVSRARSKLFFCYSGDGKPAQVEEIQRMLDDIKDDDELEAYREPRNPNDDDGLAGVREPRSPNPSPHSTNLARRKD